MRDRKNPLEEVVSSFVIIMVALRKDIARSTVEAIDGTLRRLRKSPLQQAAALPLPESSDGEEPARLMNDSDLEELMSNSGLSVTSRDNSAVNLCFRDEADENAFRRFAGVPEDGDDSETSEEQANSNATAANDAEAENRIKLG